MKTTSFFSFKYLIYLIIFPGFMGWCASSMAQNAPLKPLEAHGFTYPTYTGHMFCDDNLTVTVIEDHQPTGWRYFIHMGNTTYQALRVTTESGAIRLEDKKRGIVWLQMSNKSMLLNERLGQRMAHNCRNDTQLAVEKALEQLPQNNYLTQK